MGDKTKRGAATAISLAHTLSLTRAHTHARVCGHGLHVHARLHLVRRDEGVVQPALQHVLELGAVAMVLGHLSVAAARNHLHSLAVHELGYAYYG